MSLELLSVEKVLRTRFACVELRCLFVDAEEMLFEVVAGCEGFQTEVASVVALVEVNSEDVSGDSRFIAEGSIAPVAD